MSDKSGLVPFAETLADRGVELVSTGGTARRLVEAGLRVRPVEDLTGFPEMMDGRVKTLHPKVHGGLLAMRDNPEHQQAMREHRIEPIDLVCVNLYPFEKTVASGEATLDDAIENIDIGGPSMLRSAAKNAAGVVVLIEPAQYRHVLEELEAHDGQTTLAFRRRCAAAAFRRTSRYDDAIASYLEHNSGAPPERLELSFGHLASLRYGENPHQSASVYRDTSDRGPSVVGAEQLHGKALSYNNVLDASASLNLVHMLAMAVPGMSSAAVVKHTNPCGAAVATSPRDAVDLAIAGDPMAAYGGILALSETVDDATAERLCDAKSFFEVIVAPAFSDDALARLQSRWKNLRLLAVGRLGDEASGREFRSVPGGVLVQVRDTSRPEPASWTHAAGPKPDDGTLRAAAALECVARALSSNAVCLGGPDGSGVRLFGAGAGQMDRVAACRNAIEKAGDRASGSVAFSDAFFPFADGPELLINAGVQTIVHPGGSKRDQDTFGLCEQRGVTCLTTGTRHFRH